MQHLTLFLLLLLLTACGWPAPGCSQVPGQVQTRYYLVGSFPSVSERIDTVAGDTTYRVTMNFQADQSGNGYLPSALQAGYRVFTAAGRIYRIDSVLATTLATAELVLNPLGVASPPGLTAMAYQYDGTQESLPVPPANTTGISQAMQAAIVTHNSLVASGVALDYGRVRFVNKTFGNNATARIGDPQRPYKDWVAAAYAPDQRSGDVIYTYDSDYTHADLSSRPGQARKDVGNPRDGVVFHFSRVSFTGGPSTVTEFLFSIDLGPNGTVPLLDDSTRYRLDIRGDLNLTDMGLIVTWSDPGRKLSDGSPVPRFDLRFSIGNFVSTPYVVSSGTRSKMIAMHGPDMRVVGRARRVIGPGHEVVTTGFFNAVRDKVFRNRILDFEVDELVLDTVHSRGGFFIIQGRQFSDSSSFSLRFNTIIAPPMSQESTGIAGGNAQNLRSRLLSVDRGSRLTNSRLNVHIGEIVTRGQRGTDYVGQTAQDYSDVLANQAPGENARLIRLSGDLSGTIVTIRCEACEVEDGLLLVDQPTGTGGAIHLTGNVRSIRQSVAKFAHDSGPPVYLDGHFSSDLAPVISSDLDGQSSLARISLRGTYRTASTSFPAVALNRPMTISGALIERTKSSGSRPSIESNVAGTSLLFGGVYINAPGEAAGPNINATPLKTITPTN